MTVERDPARDVVLVRERVSNADDRYRRPAKRRPPTLGERARTFVRRWGWRAYALPILAVLTVAALMTTSESTPAETAAAGGGRSAAPTVSVPPTADAQIPLKTDDKGSINPSVLAAAALPAGAAYTKEGTGKFTVLPGTTGKVGKGELFTYSIDVEGGVTGVDLNAYATMVSTILADPRSWAGHGDLAVQRVDKGAADFRVSLTSSMSTRKFCGFDIPVETSCYAPEGSGGLKDNRVIFNVARWVRGAPAYLGDPNAYRTYMINHEIGHAFRHNHAHQCLDGGSAPVMMQQTFGLRETRNGKSLCSANPWPYPPGVKGTPGAEQVDTDSNNEYGRGD